MLDKIKEDLKKAITEFTIEDFNIYTMNELYMQIANKTNEVIEIVKLLQNYLDEQIFNDVENIELKQQTLENVFNQLIINAGNSNAEIVDARVEADGTTYSKLRDRLNKVDSQIKENAKKLNERIFKPKFGVSAYWGEVSDRVGGSYTSTLENMKNDIEIWKAHGVDEVIIPLHIGYNSSINNIFLAENLETIKQGCQEIINNGLKIACIKVHVMHLSSNDVSSIGKDTFTNKYSNIIQNICESLRTYNIEYLIPFNEVNWIYNDGNMKNFVINVINTCKSYNYKVSISTAGAEENFNMYSDIHDSLDAISINYYQPISAKNNIKNVDAYNSWKGSNILNFAQYFKNKYPSKEFIVSETGVNDFKEALISPETSFGTKRSNGIYQDIYLNGAFNYLNNSLVDRVWWWFGFDNKNNITSKTTNYYLGGAKYEF